MTQDLRLAFRQITKHPAVSAVVIVTLGIGLAVNTVAFSAVNALLFKPRAGTEIQDAGWVLVSGGSVPGEDISLPEFERLSAAVQGALVTAAMGRTPLAWQHDGTTEPIWALMVSSTYFPMLETTPLAGRVFGPADDGAPVAVVSERFWRERLAAAAPATMQLTINGVDLAIVGVLPDAFEGPDGLYAPQIWMPIALRRVLQLPRRSEEHTEQWIGMIGRVQPGVSIGEVNARLKTAAGALEQAWPTTHKGRTARFRLFTDQHPEIVGAAWILAAAMTAVGMVLLIACFNVANLLLARAIERQREMGIRTAIGASRARLLRQQLVEGLVLAMLAAVIAAIVAMWSQQLLSVFAIPIPMPQRLNVSPDLSVMTYVLLMAVLAGVLPGLAAAFQAARVDVVRALSAAGSGSASGRPSAARQTLVGLQIAGSTAFLIIAALFMQAFVWTGSVDPGFEDERAVIFSFDPTTQGHDPARAALTVARVVERIRTLPGIVGVSAADRIPFYIGYRRETDVATTPQPCAAGGCRKVTTYAVGPRFFSTMDIAMAAGEELSAAHAANAVVVNETFATQWFAAASPIGQVIRLGPSGAPHVIVGVARNTLHRGFRESPVAALYLPLGERDYEGALTIVARTSSDPAMAAKPIAEAVHAIDPNVAAVGLTTMRERMQMPRWPMRTGSALFGLCGALALLLATIGLAAVISHAVTQRRREFGVRLAVGATPTQVLRDVVAGALPMVVPGVIAGLLVAAVIARALPSVLLGLTDTHVAVYAGIAVLQITIALLACAAPARRAARVDPVLALRAE